MPQASDPLANVAPRPPVVEGLGVERDDRFSQDQIAR